MRLPSLQTFCSVISRLLSCNLVKHLLHSLLLWYSFNLLLQATPSSATMEYSDDESANESLHEIIKLKTNDFPIDLTWATIYKYTIKFFPDDIPIKEKKYLAHKFLRRLKLNRKSSTVIRSDVCELLLPNDEPDLATASFQVVCVRQKDDFDGATLIYLHGKKLYTKFLTDQLITRQSGQKPCETDFGGKDSCLQLFTVSAEKEKVDMEVISTAPRLFKVPETILRQKLVLHALDSILQQEARDTSSVRVYGNEIFEVVGEPAMEGPVIELRRGLKVETYIVNRPVV
jgi:hypothetical protein